MSTDSGQNNPIVSSSSKMLIIKLEREIVALKEKDRANMSSLDLYTDKCERLQSQLSGHAEELIRAQSERDFYKIKCHDGVSQEAATDNTQIDAIGGYIRQINRLNAVISSLQLQNSEEGAQFHNAESILETELTSNIAKLFTSTERQLRSDQKMLNHIERCPSDDDADASAQAVRQLLVILEIF
jgi:hypothetical protein